MRTDPYPCALHLPPWYELGLLLHLHLHELLPLELVVKVLGSTEEKHVWLGC